jgi:hypothetical protein
MRDTSQFHTWYKDGFFWVDPTEPWADERYGYVTNNKWDIIHNTCDRIVIENDTSDWANTAVVWCFFLLVNGRRWPARMDHKKDSRSRLHWRIRQLLRWLYLIPHSPYGWVRKMTRDPYIAWAAAASLFPTDDWLENFPRIPLTSYSPKTWRWRRRLMKDNRAAWLKELDYLRAFALVKNHEAT